MAIDYFGGGKYEDRPLVIKATYGNSLRRFTLDAYENRHLQLNMVALRAKLCGLFNIKHDADLTLTYIDEDTDVVTLADDEDLFDALSQPLNPIRMFVKLNNGCAVRTTNHKLQEPSQVQDSIASMLYAPKVTENESKLTLHDLANAYLATESDWKKTNEGTDAYFHENTICSHAIMDDYSKSRVPSPQRRYSTSSFSHHPLRFYTETEIYAPDSTSFNEDYVAAPYHMNSIFENGRIETKSASLIDWNQSIACNSQPKWNCCHCKHQRSSNLRGFGKKPCTKKLDSELVEDVQVMEGALMKPATSFTKIWLMRNNGTVVWPEALKLTWVGGHQLIKNDTVDIRVPADGLHVNDELEVGLDLTAPEEPGQYTSYWQMALPSGHRFGQVVYVHIKVQTTPKDYSSDRFYQMRPSYFTMILGGSYPNSTTSSRSSSASDSSTNTSSKSEGTKPKEFDVEKKSLKPMQDCGRKDHGLLEVVPELNETECFDLEEVDWLMSKYMNCYDRKQKHKKLRRRRCERLKFA